MSGKCFGRWSPGKQVASSAAPASRPRGQPHHMRRLRGMAKSFEVMSKQLGDQLKAMGFQMIGLACVATTVWWCFGFLSSSWNSQVVVADGCGCLCATLIPYNQGCWLCGRCEHWLPGGFTAQRQVQAASICPGHKCRGWPGSVLFRAVSYVLVMA